MKQNFFEISLVAIIVLICAAGVASASSTISTDISTGGQLTVTGTSTLNGYVGVGTTSPYARLSIAQNLTDSTIFAVGAEGSSTTLMVLTQGVENANIGRIGFGIDRPTNFFHVVGRKPGDTTATNGIGAQSVGGIQITGGEGGDTYRVASSVTGGGGGQVKFNGGPGGTSGKGTLTNNGGPGGDVLIVGGNGGVSTSTTATTNRGGVGGSMFFSGGAGGTVSGAGTLRGGFGGSFALQGGNGAGTVSYSVGGGGGGVSVQAGTGGLGTTTPGNGGSISFVSGAGGGLASGGTQIPLGGDSGAVTFQVLNAGNAVAGGNAGAFTFIGGPGGEGVTGNGGIGSTLTFTAGNGGLTTGGGNGGAAGSINFTAGTSGTGGTRPNGGSIYFLPGTGTFDGNIILNGNSAGTFRGNVGIGTSTPTTQLQVTANASNATSTLTVGKPSQNKGSCLELFDSAGTAVYAYVAAGATTFTLSTISCK